MILHFSRGFYIATRNQAQSKWDRYRADEAYGKKVCMVGYGPIARRAAGMCKALGMSVVSVRASIAEQQPGFEAVDRFYPPAELNDVLAESDYIVVAAPRTLGELRHHWHAKLKDVLVGEIAKDLTGSSAAQIEAAIAKA
jgi:phosphoglycerate dehydrogenase-like enzyme